MKKEDVEEGKALLVTTDAARFLGVGAELLRRAVRTNQIKSYRPGGHAGSWIYFRREDLLAWLEGAALSDPAKAGEKGGEAQ